MKYEAPELTALTPAIDAIQTTGKPGSPNPDSSQQDSGAAYEDWE
jgi:hypothetical protein